MGYQRVIGIVFASTMLIAACLSARVNERGTIAGTIEATAADGLIVGVPGVRLSLTCATDGISSAQISDDRGQFRFTDLPVNTCSVVTELQGFVPVTAKTNIAAGKIATLHLHLDTTPLLSGLLVTGEAPKQRH